MGCFSSRFDKRVSAYTSDLNTVGLAFIGGDKDHAYDLFPIDRVGWANDQAKEITDSCPVDGMAAANEELTTAAYKVSLAALQAEHDKLAKKYGTASDAKVQIVNNRYKSNEAIANLADAIAFLKENSGIVTDEPAAAEDKKEGEMMDAPESKPEGEEMMEGGDEAAAEGDMMMAEGAADMGMAMMAALENPHKYEGDGADYKGWANVPSALLRCMIVCPMVGDIIKAEVLQWELNHNKAKVGSYTGLAGMIGHAVSTKQDGADEFYLAGHVTANDAAALTDITTGENPMKAIHFPFITVGWKSEEEARKALAWDGQDIKGDYSKVLFKVTGAKSMNFVGCRQVAHKINGTVDAAGVETDGVTVYNVTAAHMDTKTVQQWKDDVKAAADAAAAAASAAKDAPKMEGDAPADDKKEGEEGAPAMDPPMEE